MLRSFRLIFPHRKINSIDQAGRNNRPLALPCRPGSTTHAIPLRHYMLRQRTSASHHHLTQGKIKIKGRPPYPEDHQPRS
jgi:hypothetical protein